MNQHFVSCGCYSLDLILEAPNEIYCAENWSQVLDMDPLSLAFDYNISFEELIIPVPFA